LILTIKFCFKSFSGNVHEFFFYKIITNSFLLFSTESVLCVPGFISSIFEKNETKIVRILVGKQQKAYFQTKKKNLIFLYTLKTFYFYTKMSKDCNLTGEFEFFLTNQTSLLLESVSSRATDVWHAINLD
jgi:hypothetical protein